MTDYDSVRAWFTDYPTEFAEAGSLMDFGKALQGPMRDLVVSYAGGWADRVFNQAKVRPEIYTSRPLLLPEARCWADLFAAADYTPQANRPRDMYFVSGISGGAVPSNTHAERVGVRLFADGTVVRSLKGKQAFYCTYAQPRPEVLAAIRRAWGQVGSFEAIKRGDGALVIARYLGGIATEYVALLDGGDSLVSLMSAERQAFIAAYDAREASAWAGIYEVGGVLRLDGSKGTPDFVEDDAARKIDWRNH